MFNSSERVQDRETGLPGNGDAGHVNAAFPLDWEILREGEEGVRGSLSWGRGPAQSGLGHDLWRQKSVFDLGCCLLAL